MKYEVHGFNCPKTCSEISSPFLIAHSKTSIQGRNSKLRVGLRCLLSIGKEASNEGSLSNSFRPFTAAGGLIFLDLFPISRRQEGARTRSSSGRYGRTSLERRKCEQLPKAFFYFKPTLLQIQIVKLRRLRCSLLAAFTFKGIFPSNRLAFGLSF